MDLCVCVLVLVPVLCCVAHGVYFPFHCLVSLDVSSSLPDLGCQRIGRNKTKTKKDGWNEPRTNTASLVVDPVVMSTPTHQLEARNKLNRCILLFSLAYTTDPTTASLCVQDVFVEHLSKRGKQRSALVAAFVVSCCCCRRRRRRPCFSKNPRRLNDKNSHKYQLTKLPALCCLIAI